MQQSSRQQHQMREILIHQDRLRACAGCPDMTGPVVVCNPVVTPLMLIGQAPGDREGPMGRPFAWTAGKTLFRWFSTLGVDEQAFRSQVYMIAVCRCFPGKNPKGGDRLPSADEISQCRGWWDRELEILQPRLLMPVGKLAIAQLMPIKKLADVVGQQHHITVNQVPMDVIPLPHPSGLSTWTHMSPGRELLQQALDLIAAHPAWRQQFGPSD